MVKAARLAVPHRERLSSLPLSVPYCEIAEKRLERPRDPVLLPASLWAWAFCHAKAKNVSAGKAAPDGADDI
jgi:hypothetical protein